jgi:hypothetical protein
MATRRYAGAIRYQLPGSDEHIVFPDPLSPQVVDAAYRARYHMAGLTQIDCFHLASCAEFLADLAACNSTMEWSTGILRAMRKVIREMDCESRDGL